MPFTLTWDMETHYEVAGEGHPLVLIHDLTLDGRIWNPQWKVFPRAARVVRYDLRGHGESSSPAAPFSADNLVLQLRTLLDTLKITRPVLVGHSFGAAIAVHFALRHRTRAAALVLASPAIWGAPGEGGSSDRALPGPSIDPGLLEDPRAHKKALKDWLESDLFAATRRNEQAFRWIENIVLAHGCAPWKSAEPFIRPDDWSNLPELDLPVLVLCGSDEDARLRGAARALGDRIRGARVIELPQAGRFANVESPADFNRRVLDFLQAESFARALPPGAEIPPKTRRKKKPRGDRKKPEGERFRPPPTEERPQPSKGKPERRRRRRRRPRSADETAPGRGGRSAPAEPPKEEKRSFWSRLFGKKKPKED